MSKIDYRKLIPMPILLMLISTGFFSVLLLFDQSIISSQWRNFIKGVLAFLLVLIFIYTFIDLFFKKYVLRKVSLPGPRTSSAEKDQLNFKELVEKAAPKGYKLEVSLEKGFSFCYPEDWEVVEVKEPLLYMQIRESKQKAGLSILRNFNVSHQNIEGINTDFLFQAIINGVVRSLHNGVLEFKEPFQTEETFGMRYKINYNSPQKNELCCYQIAITNKNRKSLVLLTFTTGVNDFQQTRDMFNNLAELVKIYN